MIERAQSAVADNLSGFLDKTDRMEQLSSSASAKFAAHAAELGISPEELLEQLLSKEK
jgi:hypothetical protein